MHHCKLAHALAAVAVVFASATAFRLTTGKCPLGCLLGHLHGDKPVPTQAHAETAAATN